MQEDKPPRAPKTYETFTQRYPDIGRAWELLRREEANGPLDDKTARLVKLGIALGSMREGAVHSAVRKARAAGVTREEIGQAIALAASTIGLPSAVAVFSWVSDVLDGR
jgi:alkylhydroperoxidase/carboxymuconolactone decarboxylase family protein YurZ